jgi:hypothetical protein
MKETIASKEEECRFGSQCRWQLSCGFHHADIDVKLDKICVSGVACKFKKTCAYSHTDDPNHGKKSRQRKRKGQIRMHQLEKHVLPHSKRLNAWLTMMEPRFIKEESEGNAKAIRRAAKKKALLPADLQHNYWAVARGTTYDSKGVYDTWEECAEQTTAINSVYAELETKPEAYHYIFKWEDKEQARVQEEDVKNNSREEDEDLLRSLEYLKLDSGNNQE